jgi:nitric oxide reductase NorD protein
MARLALEWAAITRRQSDQPALVHFKDTTVVTGAMTTATCGPSSKRVTKKTPRPSRSGTQLHLTIQGLPPRHYPEWDAATHTHRADWVSVYDTLHAQWRRGLTSTRCWRATAPRRGT